MTMTDTMTAQQFVDGIVNDENTARRRRRIRAWMADMPVHARSDLLAKLEKPWDDFLECVADALGGPKA